MLLVERVRRDVAGRLVRHDVLRHRHRLLGVLPGIERRRAHPAAAREHARALESRSQEREHEGRAARVLPPLLRGRARRVAERRRSRAARRRPTSRSTKGSCRWWSRRAIGRVWNVFRPWQNASLDGLVEGRGLAQARVALFAFYLYAAGRDRRARRAPPAAVSDLAVPRARGRRDVHGRDLVRDPALPHTGGRGAPRARRGGDRQRLFGRRSRRPSEPPSTT